MAKRFGLELLTQVISHSPAFTPFTMPLLTVAMLSSEELQLRLLSSVLPGPTWALSVTWRPVCTSTSLVFMVRVSAVWVTVML